MTPLSYISPKATVRDSPIHGRGLFAVAPIRKGDIVAIQGGYMYNRARRDRIRLHAAPGHDRHAHGDPLTAA